MKDVTPLWVYKNDNINLLFRHVTKNERLEIGIYPVIFGYRVRAGYNRHSVVEIDWCCGRDDNAIKQAYSIAMSVLGNRQDDANPFKGFPSYSQIKPYPNDPGFMADLLALKSKDMEVIDTPKVEELDVRKIKRYTIFEKYNSSVLD